ncbi:hypothetical protein BH23BAC3_BH23BAC3_33290 [soil metagenome]
MKYKINTILTSLVFLLVFAGLAIAHFQEEEIDEVQQSESLELHTIMRLLMLDMHTINEGIYTQNFELIESGALNINQHPALAPESRQLVTETLGERMEQFGAYDNVVHHIADSLRQAAVDEDIERVMDHYRIIEQGCISCHASFQDEIKQARILKNQQ